jgi:hypothetical protein
MTEQPIIQEALAILSTHLPPSKIARFWAALQLEDNDYATIREQLFAHETVATLFENIERFQNNQAAVAQPYAITGNLIDDHTIKFNQPIPLPMGYVQVMLKSL